MYYEFMERANLQQSDLLPKDQLVKFNEKIGSPYHVGVGLRYIEHYIGKNPSIRPWGIPKSRRKAFDLSFVKKIQSKKYRLV